MGINTLAYVPSTTDLGDLTLAIQKLTDADTVVLDLPKYQDGLIASASRGSNYSGRNIFEVTITRAKGFGDGERVHRGTIHLASPHQDWSGGKAKLLIIGTLLYCGNATKFWAALSDGLVNFFGGVVDYNDCDDSYADTVQKPTKYSKVKDGDDAWVAKQQAVNALRCVTTKQALENYAGENMKVFLR